MHGLRQHFGWGVLDELGSESGTAIEPELRSRGSADDERGRSESLDPDNVGDIADEGIGHRGNGRVPPQPHRSGDQ